jgi:hypothetical protein
VGLKAKVSPTVADGGDGLRERLSIEKVRGLVDRGIFFVSPCCSALVPIVAPFFGPLLVLLSATAVAPPPLWGRLLHAPTCTTIKTMRA